jgi:hypothetical protein
MGRQYFVDPLYWQIGDGTPVANTVTETSIFPDVLISGNYLFDGRRLLIRAKGKYSDTGTPTLIFSLRLGGAAGTLICKTPAITLPSGVSNVPWEVEVELIVRTNGATGTVIGYGTVRVYSGSAPTVASATGAAAVAPMTLGGATGPGTATVDLTTDQVLALTATWSAASASNTLTGQMLGVEAPN